MGKIIQFETAPIIPRKIDFTSQEFKRFGDAFLKKHFRVIKDVSGIDANVLNNVYQLVVPVSDAELSSVLGIDRTSQVLSKNVRGSDVVLIIKQVYLLKMRREEPGKKILILPQPRD